MKRFRPDGPIAAASALLVRRGRVLLIRRQAAPNAERWGLPGGTVELGETVRAAAAREVREETGLAVAVGGIVDVVDTILPGLGRPDYHYVLIVFSARVTGGRLRAATDAGEARWVPLADLDGLDVTETTRRVIETERRSRRRAHM